jgi:hypothetical protein
LLVASTSVLSEEYTTVSIEGLQENFDKAKLYEEVINNVQTDELR